MKRTLVVPGKPVVMKTREDEEQLLMDWINLQTTYSDSIRYLIQKEIAENGLRNLQGFIPQSRSIESMKSQMATMPVITPTVQVTAYQQSLPLQHPHTEDRGESDALEGTVRQSERANPVQSDTISIPRVTTDQPNLHTERMNEDSDQTQTPSPATSPEEIKATPNAQVATKRPAGKKFGADVASSFAN